MNYPTPQVCGISDLDVEYNKELERYAALVKEKKEIGELEDIENIEKTVNEVIARHLPVTTEFITQEEAVGRFDLKRLPDNASDTVRIVRVGDYDECLCIGLHVTNTSEIGTFRIISSDYKDGIFRIRFKLA